MELIKKLDEGLSKVLSWVTTIAMMLIVLIVCIQVFARNIIHFDLGAMTDIPVYMMIYTVFLGGVLISRKRKHIKVDVLKVFVHNRKVLTVIDLICDTLCSAAIFYFAFYSFRHCFVTLYNRGTKIAGLGIPEWAMKLIVPVGMTLIGIYFISYVVKDIISLKNLKEGK